MFRWLRRQKRSEVSSLENQLYDNKLKLPLAGIVELARYYEDYKFDGVSDDKQPKVHVHLVAIYNVDQLASEIAKRLKNSTSDGSKGN